MPLRASSAALVAATLLLTACGDERVSTYRVPKEKDPEPPTAAAADAGSQAAPAAGAGMADTAVPTAEGAALVWQAPPQWSPKPASAMRKASYSVPGEGGESDLSVTAFPGDVGGELMNVNRWRGQVGLPSIRQDELEASVKRLEANGLRFTLVELAPGGGPGAKSMLGAIVPYGGSTWFFKLMGPGPAVAAAKPAFIEFLHSVRAP
jgi:hypothetical protein